MKGLWKAMEGLLPLPYNRLPCQAEDTYSLSSTTPGHEGVGLAYIPHVMIKNVSVRIFFPYFHRKKNAPIATWMSGRHLCPGLCFGGQCQGFGRKGPAGWFL